MRPLGWDKALLCDLNRAAELGIPWEDNETVRKLKEIVPPKHLDIAMMAWVLFHNEAPAWFYYPLKHLDLKRKFWFPKKRRPIDMLATDEDADWLRFAMVEIASFSM
ncbi:MAG: hypothetical protein CVU33_16125 [Betaproteobacteria bacterium HGW-Betaproteobacteria-6]|jgi:hypothetical protein|uniref:DUF2384 domain-containing protein n=1 Tax=Candidatus Anoxymicrobium japonicum TaxID=2013648 RepID=A0A2N3G540_9ACTN|nr:MAG: hypothetical protein CVU33_16125 [Betaproteobacteria bacterium HGW-Betaproteobacteria-6]PKQ27694.1 MAG: hypothetical protein CVT63_06630 [Candidatus Anoxymicrobium japonicum]